MEVVIMAELKKVNEDLGRVIDDIEAESYRHLNLEIEVGEDGYVHDVPLLAGYVDKNGVLHDTFTFREMTGKDEEAISKSDVRQNGAKMVNILVERCVSAIGTITKKEMGAQWGSFVRELLGGDLDYMAFKIRELSKGTEVEFNHKCPSCGSKLTTTVETSEFNIKPFMKQSAISFTLAKGYRDTKGELHKEGVIRLPNGIDRELITPTMAKNPSTGTTMLLTRLVSFNDGTPVTQNGIADLSLRDRDILEKIIKENTFGVDTVLDITCSSCGYDLSGVAGQSNFL